MKKVISLLKCPAAEERNISGGFIDLQMCCVWSQINIQTHTHTHSAVHEATCCCLNVNQQVRRCAASSFPGRAVNMTSDAAEEKPRSKRRKREHREQDGVEAN